ncbi:VOC family protein [Asticcacaulis sp. DXS10W]|uniref:VOC family protein n=1 Tax=Asticcacaulis currens TaxID=2984210 RepID=A0ABT5IFM6_9CAUL|nr:VOC family protein [Asticcacaulis currens]MDC7694271.1 VOC family protein [Asticcacaulis currens]
MLPEPTPPMTLGVHHVGLSVYDLATARSFFEHCLGFSLIREMPAYPAAMVTDGKTMISLWQVADAAQSAPFDRRRNVGLHHVAFLVESPEKLEAVYAEVQAGGATIEFAPEPRADGKARHMMCTIPGGPRVEFVTLI